MMALPRWAAWALAAAAVLLLGARAVAVFTEAFNWDELAFLFRVERSIAQGELVGGGRGGLAVVPLIPLAAGCASEVATLHAARLLWLAITTAYLAGVYALLLEAQAAAGVERRHHAAALGVALLLLTPIFYRWSLQVRTDQLALACATWGAALLLRSRQLTPWALLSGVLFATGYLASQKALYVGALAALFAATDVLGSRPIPLARGLLRAGLVLGAAGLFVFIFYATFDTDAPMKAASASGKAAAATSHAIDAGLDTFGFYRSVFGYTTYLAILHSLPLHALLMLLSAAATLWALAKRRLQPVLRFSGLALLLGIGVALFHAGAFAYFWMTLGLFVTVCIALTFDSVLELVPEPRARRIVIGGVWAGLALTCGPALLDTLSDTQAVQRDSYAFVASAFGEQARGFQPEGGLFCRKDPDPLEPYMLETVRRKFVTGNAAVNANVLEREFRTRPVSFILGSQPLLALPFPKRLRRFWAEHYIPYYKAVMVPGRVFRGAAGTRGELDVLVPGRYRWVLGPGLADGRFLIDGREVAAADSAELTAGVHTIELGQQTGFAALVLDTGRPPQPDNELTFYNERQGEEIAWARDADW